MVKSKKYVLEKHFDGFPKESDLKLVEEELPAIKDGEFLSEAVYLSVDPYQRAYAVRFPVGSTMLGSQVAKIVESKNPKYPVGKYIVGEFGWRTHVIGGGTATTPGFPAAWVVPEPDGLPLSLYLGALGMTGNTAYFGLLELCKPKAGETVLVSGAAGAVGSHVGQIAKLKGCKVIGIAGSDEKGKWLTEKLKFDSFVNYKKENFKEALKEATPNGVDCYFDNVGGNITSSVLKRMNLFGRISICGAISAYNDKETPKASYSEFDMLMKQLKVEAFIVTRWNDRWLEGVLQNKQWIKEDKLQYQETITEGFENMFKAFTGMLNGENLGKAVVKV